MMHIFTTWGRAYHDATNVHIPLPSPHFFRLERYEYEKEVVSLHQNHIIREKKRL